MRIPSGVTDQYIYFIAVDSTDLKTRETGLSSFTVYRSRNGGLSGAMTTPTVNETDATNMPGVYELLLDEDMTIGAGNDNEEMVFHITQASMAPVTRVIELYRPKITVGNTLGVASDGDISGNLDGTVATVTTNTDMRGTDNAALASVVGALDDAAAAGDPTAVDTIMQYIKQLVNVLVGTTGVTTYPSSAAPANNVSIAEAIRAIYDDTNSLDTTKVPDTISLANINGEIVDVVNVDTFAEPTGVPASTATLATKIGYVYMALRNKITVTSTKKTFFDDTDASEWEKDLSDDGSTYTETKANAI